MPDKPKRLVNVSNRLPVAIGKEGGEWTVRPGAGGLVSALFPVLQRNEGIWIGWPGTTDPDAPVDQLTQRISGELGFSLLPVPLPPDIVEGFYHGFSNEIIWPLFHDMLGRCVFDPAYWPPYQRANAHFAEAVIDATDESDFIWAHDYHLMLLAQQIRERGSKRRIGLFLHIPFPSHDLFRRLPWRRELLEALLQFNLLGFQTEHDRQNFVRTVRSVIPEASVQPRRRTAEIIHAGTHTIAGHFPIGIDFDKVEEQAKTAESQQAAWLFHENLPQRKVILGVDRLDYTKGIRRRMRAYGRMLEKYPELQKKVSLVQIAVPSRQAVPEYQQITLELEQMVGHINGQFSREGWVPIHYEFRSLPFVDLVGIYRASEIMLVTPLRDGMNLVAKEYCAAHVDNDGVLVLSEFAGAAAQLGQHAVMINPNDIDGIADALHVAYHMPEEERRERMTRLRTQIRRSDVHRWAASFLKAAQVD